MRHPLRYLLLLAFLLPQSGHGQTPPPVVHAIIFYSPTCPHCHEVITQHLIPLQNQYGTRLVLMGFDTSQEYANNLYWGAINFYKIPEVDWVVPIMVVGEEVLIGGTEIPGRFPSMLEVGLAGEGIDLPDFPALLNLLRREGMLDTRYPNRRIALQNPQPGAAEPQPPSDSASAGDSVAAEDSAAVAGMVEGGDPVPGADTLAAAAEVPGRPSTESSTESLPESLPGPGEQQPPPSGAPASGTPANRPAAEGSPQGTPAGPPGAGGQVPLGMEEVVQDLESRTMKDRFLQDPAGNSLSVVVLLGMLLSLALTGYPPRVKRREWPEWTIPVLVLIGVGVASYLSYIEISHAEAACGPVGDCNTVNQSKYATLFGFLPIGVLGLMGYALIFLFWVLRRPGQGVQRAQATLGIWAAALFGTLFSLYLTFLEPFVIGASCIWCLTSAMVMTLLLWAAAPPAAKAWPGSSVTGREE